MIEIIATLILIIGFPGLIGWVVKLIVRKVTGGDRLKAAIVAVIVTFALMVAYSWVNWAQTGLFTAIGLPVAAIGHFILDLLLFARDDKANRVTDADESGTVR